MSVDSPSAGSVQAEQALAKLAQVAGEAGAAAYAVGGYVRDRLLGVATQDVDVMVTAGLRETAERLAAQLPVSLVHLHEEQPTIRLVFPDRSQFDLTLPRAGPTELPPGAAAAGAPEVISDLLTRDFTVNAMAVPVDAFLSDDWPGQVIDPTGGLRDLERRRLRATSARIWEDDPVRLWRALRLAAQLGFELEQGTEAALREHAGLAAAAAFERIREELLPLLARSDAAAWLARAADLGLLLRILPELNGLRSLVQGGYHHLDGWHHTLEVVRQIEHLARGAPGLSAQQQEQLRKLLAKPLAGGRPRLALLKLAGLLHDVGKPETQTHDEQGRIHFYGHEKLSAAMARAVGERLKLGRREIQYLEMVAGLHMYPGLLAQQQEISRRAAHRFFRKAGNRAPDVLVLAWADRLSARGPTAAAEHIERVQEVVRWLLGEWLAGGPLSHPQPPVGARAIMRRYGLEGGPEVGRALRVLSRRHAEQPFMDAESAWAFLDRVVQRPDAREATPQRDDGEGE